MSPRKSTKGRTADKDGGWGGVMFEKILVGFVLCVTVPLFVLFCYLIYIFITVRLVTAIFSASIWFCIFMDFWPDEDRGFLYKLARAGAMFLSIGSLYLVVYPKVLDVLEGWVWATTQWGFIQWLAPILTNAIMASIILPFFFLYLFLFHRDKKHSPKSNDIDNEEEE